ncbi:ferric reductase like transmembrane component-domain-containing protein [Microdochium trichocladiopsis]|uniref:ferric-chelate reductase (NADPH) n=1 Tax=Microdochium trichocladiopsis TaxID=1682393 RepID=A0A9P8YFI2_9PEZI|nr:ferric reductase like transmembrane component-domain-containing protein [Microdochium trichocladiopsis]KAH7038046.1 ferric reductase like transmembrane component-domain-containing protein [Microdochium trichocladiopsis]
MSSATAVFARAGDSGAGQADGWTPAQLNAALVRYLMYICAIVSALTITWRAISVLVRYVRTVTCLTNDTQRYFAKPSSNYSWLKKNLLYAPMIRKRHNREFQLSSAINVGTLPTRLQFLFLVAYLATNVVFCVINVSFAASFDDTARLIRSRTGTLSVVNMIPLFIMAGRNNPLCKLLGVSFDTFNLMHRWFGRIVVLEGVAHVVAYWLGSAYKTGFLAAFTKSYTSPPFLPGFIAVIAFVVIFFQASSIARHAFYESFKILHILLAVTAVVGLYYHLLMIAPNTLTYLKWLYPAIVAWALDRFIRMARVMYHNLGHGGTKTLVEALPGNAVRVTVTMARPWTFRPGQHAYLYLPSISFWQSHPFSLAWSEESESFENGDKVAMNRNDILGKGKTTMSFIIRARTGMTNALYQRAAEARDGRLTTTCLVEGPYGGEHPLHSYGTAVLFAGGVGITHQVPHVRDLVAGFANGTVATRKVVLVWVIQSPEHLEWIRPWMTQILAMDRRREILRIMLFVSRPRSTKEIHSPSSTVQMFPGRPNIETLLSMEMENQIGAMAVTVCGPGALSDEVRQAVRRRQYSGSVDFIEEAFSW